jgi:processive 1,2-diacylglycerol beta-glucosyltransferase
MSERRALILSGHFGAGHDVVAEACAEAIAAHGVKSKILDAMILLGKQRSKIGDAVFNTLFASSTVYDGFHFSHMRTGSRVARGLDSLARRNILPRLRSEGEKFEPDLIVSVFATGGAAAAQLKSEFPHWTTVVFCTDTWLHRLWLHEKTDLYLVTSRTAEASVRAYYPRAQVRVVPAPARPGFYDPPSREEARAALGVPVDARCVLLMAGAWGLGPLDEAAAGLARAGMSVLAVAGNNQKLRKKLEAVASRHPTVQAFGFTDRVPELMSACDVVVTTSGDTCTEARVIGRGMVLLDVVPGHGRENVMHQLELGHATVSKPDPETLVESVDAFLDDPEHTPAEAVRSRDAWEAPFLDALREVGYSLG